MMLDIIKNLLLKIIDDIDQACNYLGISRATFDNYVREGKIPKGLKQPGFRELFWLKRDLDEIKERLQKK